MRNKFIVLFILFIVSGKVFSQILVPFAERYSVTQKGGLVMVANAIVSCNGGASCTTGQNEVPPAGTEVNNNFNSAYIDIDADVTTFSSSSANLNLPLCSKVTFAGLYWSAVVTSGNAKYTQRNKIKLKTPGSSTYVNLTADTTFDSNSGYVFYNGYKNITSYVRAAGNGTYTLADMVSNTGGTNQWGGWTIVVVYKNELLNIKNITVFDGLANVDGSSSTVTVNVDGFYTPPSGAVNLELGEIAFDGDRDYTGDSLLFKGNTAFIPVSDALHPVDDVFNSSITTNGAQVLTRNPAYKNLLGFDACIFQPNNVAKNYLNNGVTSAFIKVTTGGETVLLRTLTSVIDSYEPDLAMEKIVTDVNGGPANPGDTLSYTVTTVNAGNDTSVATTIIDTIPFNSSYVAGSMRITTGPNQGVKTDVAGDDQAEFINSAGYQILKVRLGTGANSVNGGQVPYIGSNNSTAFTFKTRITDDCTKLICNPTVSNQANIDFNGFISGLARAALSKPALFDSLGCPIEGYTTTNINVPASCGAPPDTSVGGCLPLVFATVPNIRSGYTYYDSWWNPVTQANTIGPYHGVRIMAGTSCQDTININVFVPAPTNANAGPDQNFCNVANTTMAGNNALIGTGTWTRLTGPNVPTITSPNSPTTTITGMITGIYTFTWSITTGCDSTADTMTVNISALPSAANAGTDQNICNLTNTSLGAIIPGTGVGNWILVSGPNVPNILNPLVNNSLVTGMIAGVYTFRWTVSNGLCSNSSDDVQITIYAPPTAANAGTDQNLCSVTSTSVSGNNPAIGTGTWSFISGPNTPNIVSPSNPTTGINNLISGIYIFRWTISNGVCVSSTDDIQINISSVPTGANAGIDQSLCNATSALFAGNTPATGTGTWTLVSGPNIPTITTPNNPASTVTGLVDGVYIFRWTVANGFCSSSFDDMQITVYDLPPVANAGGNQVLCDTTSFTLGGNSAGIGTGNWLFVSGPNIPTITNPANPTSTVTGIIEGTYVFRWTISYGICTPTSDDVQITTYDLPTVSNAGSDLSFCNVTSLNLAGNFPASGSGTWTLVSGPNAPSIISPSSSNSSVTGLIDGIYIFNWTIDNGSCASSSDSVQMTIYALPTPAAAGFDQLLCNIDSTMLAGNNPVIGTGIWTQLGGPNTATITTPTANNSQVTGMINGVYFFQWTISYGICPSTSDNVRITIFDIPTVSNAGANQNLCNVTTTNLDGNTAIIGSGLWTLVSGPNSPTITTPNSGTSSVTGMIAGIYIFRWTITNGSCAPTFSDVTITIDALPTVANSGPDQNLCNVNSTVLAGNNPIIGSGLWSFVSGPNTPTITTPGSPSSTVTGMIAGDYTLNWEISNGVCPSSDNDILISIADLPTISNAGPLQTLCSATSATLLGNTPTVGTGFWTRVSGPNFPTIVDPDSATTLVTGMVVGLYKFRWTISNGSCPPSISNVDIDISATASVANAGPDQSLCNVNNTTLNGNVPAPGLGTWTLISGPNVPTITAINNPASTVTGMVLGTYQFGWTIVNGGCSSATDTVEIINSDLPSVSNAGPDQDLCTVTSTTLLADTPAIGIGSWSLVSGPNVPTITDTMLYNTSVSNLITGVYVFRWTVVSGLCATSTDDVTVSIYNIPTFVDGGPDQGICNLSVTTMAGNMIGPGFGTWTIISGPGVPSITSINDPATTISSLTAGTYEFGWTISNGVCVSSTDTVVVNVYDLPSISNAGPNQNLCNASSTTLSGNSASAGIGNWSLVSGPNAPVITDITDSATTVTNLIAGTYIFRWTVSNGSCSSSTSDVQIIVYAIPLTVDAGPNQSLCNTNVATMAGNIPATGTGIWTFENGLNVPTITAPNNPSTTITGLQPGIYEFGWTISNGVCITVKDIVQIRVFDLPTVSNAGPDQSNCNVNKIFLNAAPAVDGIGLWSVGSGPNVPTITDPGLENTDVTGVISGNYKFVWTVSNGTCSVNRDTVDVAIYALQTSAAAGGDQYLCNIDSTTMSANTPAVGIGTWSLLNGPSAPMLTDINDPNTKIYNLVPGIYIFSWSVDNGSCVSSVDTIKINIFGFTANSNAGPDQNICNSLTATLAGNTPSYGSGLWSLISGPNAPVIAVPANPASPVSGLTFGTYEFLWTITNGACVATRDTVAISIYDLPGAATAGTDQALCNVNAVTMAGNTPFAGIGTWSMITGVGSPVITNPNDPVTSITNLVQGDYIFRWTVTNSVCTQTSDDVDIKISNPIVSANAGTDQGICNANAATFAALTPVNGTGTWTTINGPNTPTITSPNSETSTVTGMIDGVYIFCWTITNGACATSTDTVQIGIYDLPTIANAGTLQTSCSTTSITLTGNGPTTGTGNWTMLSGPNTPLINSPGSNVTIVTNYVQGTYFFIWTISNGACSISSDTVQISTFDQPTNSFAGPDQAICETPAITLAATKPTSGIGTWSLMSGPNTPTIIFPDSANSIVTGIVPGVYVYRWTVSNNICTPSTDDSKVTIYANPSPVNAGSDQQWCDSTTVTIAANIPSVGIGFWSFLNGPNVPTVTSPANPSVNVSNMKPGTYGFQWTIANGLCFRTDQVYVDIHSSPVVTATQHYFNNCLGDKYANLEASGASTYSWSPTSYLDNSAISNPVATITKNIQYWVTGIDSNGCSSSDSVIIEACDSLFISDGFSPDGDGINDELVIIGLENYPDNVLHIFNRWGNLLYEKKNYDNSWNGVPTKNAYIIGSGKVQSGTYFYLLELGENRKRTGYIEIKY